MKTESAKIPLTFHLIYLSLAAIVAYLYYLKIVLPLDPGAAQSIDSVLTFQTYKPYQFRLLVPFIFLILKPFTFFPQKILYLIYSITIVYLIVLIYYKILCQYFGNLKLNLFLSPVILYPILWNYVILNQSYQYYDFTSIFIFTIGIYLLIKEWFSAFFILFTIGVFNKETAGYLIFVYLLYNYRKMFEPAVVLRALLLILVYNTVKISLTYLFWNNPGSSIEICMDENINIITNLFSNRIYLKHLLLNFGALYIFLFLLLLQGRWREFKSRQLLYLNFAFLPNIFLGFFVTYFNEVRVYAEFIPLITTLFLIYLSTFKKLNLQPVERNH